MINAYLIRRPIITEKSMAQTAMNRYTFEVDKKSTKGQIKAVIEETFAVDVVSVTTARIGGKKRRVGKMRRQIEKPGFKKAFVQIKEGQKIDIFEAQT